MSSKDAKKFTCRAVNAKGDTTCTNLWFEFSAPRAMINLDPEFCVALISIRTKALSAGISHAVLGFLFVFLQLHC